MANDLTEEQAYWLRRILENRARRQMPDPFIIPHDVYHALIAGGLVRWNARVIEVTHQGLRAIARHQPPE